MLKYLVKLPTEILGENILGYLDLGDIVGLENAAASKNSQQLLKTTLPYCPPFVVEGFVFNHEAINWCNKRRLHVQHANILIESLCEINDSKIFVFKNIVLCLNCTISLQHIEPLKNRYINQTISHVRMKGDQDPAVMEVLFSLLSNSSSVRSIDIYASNLSQWSEHIKKIESSLHELLINDSFTDLKTITEYCPYLEKLRFNFEYGVSGNHFMQTMPNNSPHIRSLYINYLGYISNAECDADLTVFAEKCPQLEELSLCCWQLTDQSVIALTQHCSRLKKLKLHRCNITFASLKALSERGLPLEELIVPSIPIPSAEIATQCAHALSRIREFSTPVRSIIIRKLKNHPEKTFVSCIKIY